MKQLEIFPLPKNSRFSDEERESWNFIVIESSESIRLAFNLLEKGNEKAFLSFSEADNWLKDTLDTIESYHNDFLGEGEGRRHGFFSPKTRCITQVG